MEATGFCGFLNVLKPPGMTSAQVVGMVHRLLDGAKIGHAGTLDPEAAGVLPLMVGKATRLFDLMQMKQKTYVTEIAFGQSTDTQDAQGVTIAQSDRYPSEAELLSVLPAFTGEILQTPPMFSAIKQNGRRLYDLARNGQTAEVESRPVTVHELKLLRMTEPHGALCLVRCSKGFYVRTLCHDIGRALDCPSHMRFLLRVQSGPFTLDNAHTLEELARAKEEGHLHEMLIQPQKVLPLRYIQLPGELEKAFYNGGKLPRAALETESPLTDEEPFGILSGDKLLAIARPDGKRIHIQSWLADGGKTNES